MKYKLEVNGVEDTETGMIIPNDLKNKDWRDYLTWVAEGNVADAEFSDAEIENKRVAQIKAIAGMEIVAIMPEWKQRNSIARMVALLLDAVDLSVLPADDLAEISAAMIQWDDVTTVRTTSDTAETAGTAPEDIVW